MSTNERQLKMLRKLVQADSPARLAALVQRMDIPDLAQLLLTARPGEVRRLVEPLRRTHRAGDFLRSLPEATLREVWGCIPGDLHAGLLEDVGQDDAVTVLRRLGPQHCDILLAHMPPEQGDLLARLLRYPEGSAGGLMTTEILTMAGDTTTGDAVELLRAAGEHATAVDNLCVVDRAGHLQGVVTLRQLLLADPERPLQELWVWAHSTRAEGVHLWLAGVLFLAMLVNMSVGCVMGAAVPLALRALRLDPALGSSIVVTAVTDGFGFFSFLGLATIAMRLFS